MKKNNCLIEECPNDGSKRNISRGLCSRHYTLMGHTVKKGTHTWEEFEECGMSLPPRQYNVVAFEKVFLIMLEKRKKMIRLSN